MAATGQPSLPKLFRYELSPQPGMPLGLQLKLVIEPPSLVVLDIQPGSVAHYTNVRLETSSKSRYAGSMSNILKIGDFIVNVNNQTQPALMIAELAGAHSRISLQVARRAEQVLYKGVVETAYDPKLEPHGGGGYLQCRPGDEVYFSDEQPGDASCSYSSYWYGWRAEAPHEKGWLPAQILQRVVEEIGI